MGPDQAARLQDAAAERMYPVWTAALTAARAGAQDEAKPPTAVEAATTLAVVAVFTAVLAQLSRRRAHEVPTPTRSRDQIRDEAIEESPRVAQDVWLAVTAHTKAQPRSTDAAFARRGSWSSGAEVASLAQVKLADEIQLPYKVWISRGDQRVRTLHRKLHGDVVKVGDPFRKWPDGQVLRFPGDPLAPLDATINCRCFMFLVESPAGVREAFAPADFDAAFALAASLESAWMNAEHWGTLPPHD